MKYLIPVFALSLAACSESVAPETQTELVEEPIITAIAPAPVPAMGSLYFNQIGFTPNGPKIAILQSDSEAALQWLLRDKKGGIVRKGASVPLGYAPLADQNLHRVDFSDVTTSGKNFSLQVGGSRSEPFDIMTGKYGPLAKDAMAYFYHNRAGEDVLAEHVGQTHARPAGDANEVVTCFKGIDKWGTEWPGCDYELNVTGGWYDAGDHGKYVVNSGISVWTLMNAYERNPDVFPDGSLNIPEAGNGVPDILDEARKNIEFMIAMQIPVGRKAWVAIGKQTKDQPLTLAEIDAGGLVHHKVSDIKWPGDGVMPHENDSPRALYAPSTGATLNVAAVGAQCARIWKKIDPAFSRKCANASQKAFAAAVLHDDIFAYNNFDGSGPYDDKNYADEMEWAAMEMMRLQLNKRPVESLEAGFEELDYPSAASFNKTQMLATLSAMRFETEAIKPGYADNWKRDFILKADRMIADIDREPLYIPYTRDTYQWGSNSQIANRAIVLGTAYDITGEKKYREGVVHLMDYLLGRNPLSQSYVSGYGRQSFKNPHHRHWAASVREGAPTIPPGVLSGGPNNDNMSDPVAKTQVGKCAAQTCWTDNYYAWTQNEITINWNAPLVWMAAFLDDTEEK